MRSASAINTHQQSDRLSLVLTSGMKMLRVSPMLISGRTPDGKKPVEVPAASITKQHYSVESAKRLTQATARFVDAVAGLWPGKLDLTDGVPTPDAVAKLVAHAHDLLRADPMSKNAWNLLDAAGKFRKVVERFASEEASMRMKAANAARAEAARLKAAAEDPKYQFGVVLPGKEYSILIDPDGTNRTGPTREQVMEKFDAITLPFCEGLFGGAAAVDEAMLGEPDSEGMFYVLNAAGQFAGAVTLGGMDTEHRVVEGLPWNPEIWRNKLEKIVPKPWTTHSQTKLERYKTAKLHGLVFNINYFCTVGSNPGFRVEKGQPRDPKRPKGAGKALMRGIRSFVYQTHVQPAEEESDRAIIKSYCFMDGDMDETVNWWWVQQLKFEEITGLDPKDLEEGLVPMYREIFGNTAY